MFISLKKLILVNVVHNWLKVWLKRIGMVTIEIQLYPIKLMKGKALKKHSLHEKTAASVLLKLFISSNE